ncbi:MAG: hypothetical protein EPN89_05380 [Methylovulum sp.]|nr:MAG: hypothetical protein EPN89_05380 [Methylovulum sp.]
MRIYNNWILKKMALKISKEVNQFRCDVIVSVPVDKGHSDQKITVKFKVLPQSRIQQVIDDELNDGEDILDEVLVGWDDGAFKDDDDAPLLYNDDNKKLILDVPYVRSALIKAYFKAINGKEYKRKN